MTQVMASGKIRYAWQTDVALRRLHLQVPFTAGDSIHENLACQIERWVDSELVAFRDAESHQVRLQLQNWFPGHYQTIGYGVGAWQGWCYLSPGSAEGDDSGAVCLLDPRAGSANVSVPGLPWGRPIVVRPGVGVAVLCPSWLGWSVLPVVADDPVLVVRIEVVRSG